ncbi:MAG: DUF4421 family protein [Bdellovibrionales bacterium]
MGKTLGLAFLIILPLVPSVRAGAEPSEPLFKENPYSWMVQGVMEFPFYSFYVGAPAIHGHAYLPNFAPRLGPRVSYEDLGFIITFGLPQPRQEKQRRGDSTYKNVVLSSYWRQNAMDLYFQDFKGFYASSPFTELSFAKPARYPQLPDAHILNAGFNWYYVVNPTRYSLRAAFDQTEFQLRSGGSWVYHPFFNHLEIYLGNAFVPGSNPNALSAIPNLAAGRFDTLGLGAGYGYTYIRSYLFACIQGVLGPALQLQKLQRTEGGFTERVSYAGKLNVNFSAGWNYDRDVYGAKVLIDSLWARVENTEMYSSLVGIQIFYGRRF